MSGTKTVIHWFRQDLRLADNPALSEAVKAGRVLPVYILDDVHSGKYKMGGASRWWLHHSLNSLNESLSGKLAVYAGDAVALLEEIAEKHKVQAVYWNRCYEPWRVSRDGKIKEALTKKGVQVHSFNGSLLWEPWEVLKSDGTPYKVFTPFYRRGCLGGTPPREPLPRLEQVELLDVSQPHGKISELNLLPKISWDEGFYKRWKVGEKAAEERLYDFLRDGITGYKSGRDFPAEDNVSRLSPYLHFGEISPNQVWHAARMAGDGESVDSFCSELGWREFSHSLLYYFPELPFKNLQNSFDKFPWVEDAASLKKWQCGLTGYPLIDAGMRQLWQTGYMHNRVRMVVASFLVKNLLIDWRHGERWFWDCLVDADLANNSASWQWVAGCGADAAPYFRIFNPVTQGHKFDPEGIYTKRFVPELSALPIKYLFSPWEAPEEVLSSAGVKLGSNYPLPIVDVAKSRVRALEAYAKTRS